MPSKSKKQHKFMAAVANNPEFATEVGVPQSVGDSYMAKDKKVKKYMLGGAARMTTEAARMAKDRAAEDAAVLDAVRAAEDVTSFGNLRSAEAERGDTEDSDLPELMTEQKKKKKKKGTKKSDVIEVRGGGVIKYNRGGSVRGAGCARQGVRPAKMVKMKGS